MRLSIIGKGFGMLGMVLGVLTFTGRAAAEPLSFKDVQAAWVVNQDFVTVDLFAIPPPVLTGNVSNFSDGGVVVRRPVVFFRVPVSGVLPPGGSDVLRLTFGLPPNDHPFHHVVQELLIEASHPLPEYFSLGMDYPILYHPSPMTVTVDLLRSAPDFVIPGGPRAGMAVDSYTYTFSVVQPVPEPTSIALFGTGIAMAISRRLRRSAVMSTSRR